MPKISLLTAKDVPVIYIGPKRPKVERTYGTKLKFMPGQAHVIRSDVAQQLLEHSDVYTSEGTPELAAFIEANPADAHAQGLHVLSEDELKEQEALQAAQAEAAAKKAEEAKGMVIPENTNEGDDDTALLIADAKAEIEACANKGAIQDWVNENELNIELEGSRPEYEEQAINAYTNSLEAGE